MGPYNSSVLARPDAQFFVTCLYEDRDGNLWIGTWSDGVIRYDGRHATVFTTQERLAANAVSDNNLGNAYAMKGDMTKAALTTSELSNCGPRMPASSATSTSLTVFEELAEPETSEQAAAIGPGGAKAGVLDVDVASFYWVE